MNNNSHILSAYDEEIKALRSIVSRMGGMAIDQLLASMQAFREINITEAQKVVDNDKELSRLEFHAEKTAIEVFARRAPVADDLREIVSSIKMTTLIARIGDYAKNISGHTLKITEYKPVITPQTFNNMTDIVHRMIEDIMNAYAHRNTDINVDILERNETLVNVYNAMNKQILKRMAEEPDRINVYTHYLAIAECLKRIGEQAIKIAEQVYYSITGSRVKNTNDRNQNPSKELG